MDIAGVPCSLVFLHGHPFRNIISPLGYAARRLRGGKDVCPKTCFSTMPIDRDL